MGRKKIFLCILPYFNFGGAATLYFRILKWSSKNGYHPILMTKDNEDFNREWLQDLGNNKIQIIFYEEKYGHYYFYCNNITDITMELSYESITCITSTIFEYFVADYLRQNICTSKFNIYFYVIHPLTVYYTKNQGINYIYRKQFLDRIFRSGSLIFMDEETRDTYLKKGGTEAAVNRIIRLGMEIREYPEQQICRKAESEQLNIISICRMEIPFKGYILGLLDDFVRLQKKFCNLRLIIIGDGTALPIIKNKVKGFEPEVQSRVKLLGDIPYTKIEMYIKKSHVLVGMGTTILDGANAGVPCCVVASYQTENYTCGLFHNAPNILGYTLNEIRGETSTIYDDVSQILNLTKSDYLRICHKTYEVYKENYDINETMQNLTNISTFNIKIAWGTSAFFKVLRFMVEKKQWLRKTIKRRNI